MIIGPGFVAATAEDGQFEIVNVPPGTYEILAQREHLTATRQTITVYAAQVAEVDFALSLSPVHEEITVTANPSGSGAAFEAFNAVSTLDSFDLVTGVPRDAWRAAGEPARHREARLRTGLEPSDHPRLRRRPRPHDAGRHQHR